MKRIAKYLLIAFLLTGGQPTRANTSGSSSAATIHIILFADTDDSDIGKSSEQAYHFFDKTFVDRVKRHTGATVKTYFFKGSDFTLANLNRTITNLSTSSNDAIFFHFIGHGYNRNLNNFPTITLGKNGDPLDGRRKDLLDVYNELRRKPHRLLITMAEACNRPAQTRENLTRGDITTTHPAGEDISSNYRKLFLEARGDYMVSSSERCQYSYSSNGNIGYFSNGFRVAFTDKTRLPDRSQVTWNAIFSETKENTKSIARQNGVTQVPQLITGEYNQTLKNCGTTPTTPTSATLTVDGKTAVSTSFDHRAYTENFSVSTNQSNYKVELLPSWCTVRDKTSNSFTMACEANTSTSRRTDYFKVTAGDKSVRIDVAQSGKPEEPPQPQTTNITVVYTGDMYGCNLQIPMTIDGVAYPFQINGNNTVTFFNIPIGTRNYAMHGPINCMMIGGCMASGTGAINVRQGSTFHLRWVNTAYATCRVWLD